METRYSFCRLCPGLCGIRVDVEDGRAVKVIGDKDNPSTYGYTCKKGRSLPDFHYQPQRVLHPLRKLPDGSHERIASEQALDEIAEKLKDIVDSLEKAIDALESVANTVEQIAVKES